MAREKQSATTWEDVSEAELSGQEVCLCNALFLPAGVNETAEYSSGKSDWAPSVASTIWWLEDAQICVVL